jgi:hypothetical protein
MQEAKTHKGCSDDDDDDDDDGDDSCYKMTW